MKLPDFTGMLQEARKVNSKYALAAFGVIAVIAIVILLLGRLKITTFDALQTLSLIGMLLLTLIILVIFGPRENQPRRTEPIVPPKIKPIGNPEQGKLGILIDLSHRQSKWQRSEEKEKGSIFELMEPKRQLISLIQPPGKVQIPWDIRGIKEKDQFNSEDLMNWRGMIFGIPLHNKISQNVCSAIIKWVHQGGRLIMLGYELGDKHHRTNLNQLAQKFGLWFNSDIVGPEYWNNPNFKPYHQDIQFDIDPKDPNRHRILNEVRKLIFRKTCTLNAEAGTSNIITVGNNRVCKWPTAKYNEDGSIGNGMQKFEIIPEASWVPVVAEAPRSLTRKGRVIAIGTWDFFGIDECFKNADNYRFVKNLLEWLSQESST